MRRAAGLKRILLLVLASVVSLGVAESILRALRPEAIETASLSLYRTDPVTAFSLRPGFIAHLPDGSNVVINDLGLRDAPVRTPKPDGTLRILCLGDSFVFGLGVDVEQSFPKRCEILLRDSSSSRVEVINCGVPAWGTDESRRFFESRALAFEPDVVVLSIFAGNDTFDDLATGEFTVDGGLLVPTERSEPLPWDRALSGLALWSMLKRVGDDLVHSDVEPIVTTGGAKRRTMAEMLEVYRRVEILDSDAAEGRRAILENVAAIRDRARRQGILFGVVLIPALTEVDDAAFAQVIAREHLSPAEFDPGIAATRLGDGLRELDVPFLDLAAAFREATNGDGRKLYLRNYHFNSMGHLIAGRHLTLFLRDRLRVCR